MSIPFQGGGISRPHFLSENNTKFPTIPWDTLLTFTGRECLVTPLPVETFVLQVGPLPVMPLVAVRTPVGRDVRPVVPLRPLPLQHGRRLLVTRQLCGNYFIYIEQKYFRSELQLSYMPFHAWNLYHKDRAQGRKEICGSLPSVTCSLKLELTDAALDVGVIAPGPVPPTVDGGLVVPGGGVAPALPPAEILDGRGVGAGVHTVHPGPV